MVDKRIEIAMNLVEKDYYKKYFSTKESNTMSIELIEDETHLLNENIGLLPNYLLSQSYFFLIKSMYHTHFTKDNEVALSSLAQASSFSYLTLDTLYGALCDCREIRDSGYYQKYSMSELMPFASIPLIVGDFKKSEVLTQELIDSLNGKSCLIERGEYNALEAWFIIKLTSQAFGIELDKRKPRYPNKEKFKFYQDVLDNWDSEDIIEVDKMAYVLSELHLSIDYKLRINDLIVKPYFIKIFPYEILTWLKLRKRAGLKNPKTFTHPLMNTPIAKMFLDIKEPLPKPKELPYAKDLLEKLKEQCPNVEIPQWLDANNSTQTKRKSQSDDLLPEDFLK